MRRLLLVLVFSIGAASASQGDDNATLAQTAVQAERRGDFATAISAFHRLIRSGGDSPDVRNNLGIAYFQTGKYANALKEFRTALAASPDSLAANLFSGLSLLKLGRPKEALIPLQRAQQIRSTDPQILLALAQASLGAKDVPKARDRYRQATELQPDNAEGWYGLGISDRVLAETETKRAKQASSASNPAAMTNARALLRESEQAIAKAVQLDPSSVRSHLIFGEALRIAERYPEAVHEYEAATAQSPYTPAAWAGLAAAYSAAGDDDKALQAGKHALELDPRDADTTALMAGTCLRQGNAADAEVYAQRALAIQPDVTAAHVVLAKIYIGRHELDKALPELERAAPDDRDGTIHYLLATTLRQLGKTREAAVAMQQYQQLHARALSGTR
jgi:tetratricopeptide (TPR) repeat protein